MPSKGYQYLKTLSVESVVEKKKNKKDISICNKDRDV